MADRLKAEKLKAEEITELNRATSVELNEVNRETFAAELNPERPSGVNQNNSYLYLFILAFIYPSKLKKGQRIGSKLSSKERWEYKYKIPAME
jgi:hypothetical protein